METFDQLTPSCHSIGFAKYNTWLLMLDDKRADVREWLNALHDHSPALPATALMEAMDTQCWGLSPLGLALAAGDAESIGVTMSIFGGIAERNEVSTETMANALRGGSFQGMRPLCIAARAGDADAIARYVRGLADIPGLSAAQRARLLRDADPAHAAPDGQRALEAGVAHLVGRGLMEPRDANYALGRATAPGYRTFLQLDRAPSTHKVSVVHQASPG